MSHFRVVTVFFIFLLLVGCTASLPGTDPLVTRLKNRGIVPVSPDNPFLATNLLLTKSADASPEIKGFLEHRGRPSSLMVEKNSFGPMMLTLFYSDAGQYFSIEDGESVAIIRGPFPISDAQKNQLSALGETVNHFESTERMSGVIPPTATPTATPKTVKTEKPPFRSPPQIIGASPVITSSGEEAEITPRGDVVHYVTSSSENIDQIAGWYTDDMTNGEKLLRLNNLQTLEIGDTVVIPSYMVKRKTRMVVK